MRFHVPLRRLAAGFATLGLLAACAPPDDGHVPTVAEIESAGMHADAGQQADAEAQLRHWVGRGLPVAQRELGLLYLHRPDRQADARVLLAQAGEAGDGEAAFRLGELFYHATATQPADFAMAWKWYRQAAEHQHAQAALALGRMARNGEGVPRDAQLAARWLGYAADRGNAQAMFLLSNAYMAGEGVPRNPLMARRLLELAADKDYPVAIQALAMAVQAGDLLIPQDRERADHLLKEASEERRNRWNSY